MGVTGHRPGKLAAADPPRLRERVTELLRAVQQAAGAVAADRDAGYGDAPPVLRVVSALAEGADRLVAEAGLELGYELQVILPYPAEVYAREFEGDASRREFEGLLARAGAVFVLDGAARQAAAYEAAGTAVLQQSDVLLAIWDGGTAAGTGGTAHIVQQAVEADIPVAWVRSQPPHDAALLVGDGDATATRPVAGLGMTVTALLRPPAPVPPVRRHGRSVADLRERFFAEPRTRGWLGQLYGVVANLLTRPGRAWPRLLPRDYAAATREAWRAAWRDVPEALVARIDAAVLEPYAWADHLATYYANRYRSAFTATYILAPLAVLAALGADLDQANRAAWVIAEVAMLVGVLGVYLVGRRRLWHERWVDYRSLAEQLRHLTVLLPVGRGRPQLRVPAHEASGDPRATWVQWYVRAVARHAGLFPAAADAAYLNGYRRLLRAELVGQAAYHASLAWRTGTLHHRVHSVVVILFVAALTASALHLAHVWPVVLTPLTVLLPALGGAMHGFLSQGDFRNLARRSQGVRAGLERLLQRLDRLRAPSLAALGGLAAATAEVMGEELIDWRVEVGEKPLSLPQAH